ncbi:MAG: YfhO family protein [Tenericutes bacterium]|nr:YfhO family protein [Mycoplasmatota bacterium]
MYKFVEKHKYEILAFLLSFLVGCLMFLPITILEKGLFFIGSDFNLQQMIFGEVMNYSLKEGSYLWTWFNDLGSDFIGTFSFYNLFSPFNVFTYLFPARWYPYLCSFLTIVKFGVGGLTSYLFLKRYVKNKKLVLLGSLLYSFSGFQFTNMLFHYYDSVVLFPLLLYALDNLIYDNRKGYFALTVSLLAFTNWFMFIGEVVFVVIYYIVKVICKSYVFDLKKFFNILLEGVLGTLLASVVLVPSLFFTISNPRISNSFTLSSSLKYSSLINYIEIFRAFFFPSEVMTPRAYLDTANYASVDLYLPFVGSVLAISYSISKKKSWISILMFTCIFFMLVPILNSSFFLFTTSYYARWFYMPTLVLALLSIKCIEENISIKSGTIISFLSLGVMILSYFVLKYRYPEVEYIHDIKYLIMMISFMIINLVILILIYKSKNRLKYLFIFTILFVGIWSNYSIYKYRCNSLEYNKRYYNYIHSYKEIKFDDLVRTNSFTGCFSNQGIIFKNGNLLSFNTNMEGSAFEFYNSVDYQRLVSTSILVDSPLNQFLSVKYFISCTDEEKDDYKLYKDTKNYKIYLNDNYKEMGFVFNKYISNKEFLEKSTEEKYNIINSMIILDDEQITKYKDYYNEDVKVNSNKFKFINNGFISDIDVSKDTLVLYSVPYDKGWKAFNNGREVEIENVDNGMMAIKINKGMNNVKFTYYPRGLKLGLWLSIVSYIGLLIYCIKSKRCS